MYLPFKESDGRFERKFCRAEEQGPDPGLCTVKPKPKTKQANGSTGARDRRQENQANCRIEGVVIAYDKPVWAFQFGKSAIP